VPYTYQAFSAIIYAFQCLLSAFQVFCQFLTWLIVGYLSFLTLFFCQIVPFKELKMAFRTLFSSLMISVCAILVFACRNLSYAL